MEVKKRYKMTEAGVIPEDWATYPFAELGNLSKSKISPQRDRKNYKCIELEHIEQGTGQLIGSVDSIHQLSDKWLFSDGDVLFGKLRPYLRKYYLANFTGVCTTEIWVLKPSSKTISPYLYFVVQSDRFIESANLSTGTKMPRAEWKTVSQTPIPLPPTLTEQRAIATALSDVDRLLSAYDQLIAKKQAIKQGAMQELLTGKRRLEGFEGEWEDWRVGDLGYTYSGLTGKTKEDFSWGDGRYITFLNVMNNVRIDINILESVNIKVGEHQNTAQVGDLFFNTSSETPGEVGMCAVLLADVSQVYLNSFCFGFRLHEGIEIEPIYLAYYFRSSVGRNAFYSLAQGATRYNLSKSNFNNITLNLPQLDEQRAIAQILTDMDAEIAALEQQRDKYKAVKQGMMQELLTGKTRLI